MTRCEHGGDLNEADANGYRVGARLRGSPVAAPHGGAMAALGDVITVCAVGFALFAVLSLVVAKPPAVPPFARRAATSGNPQLRQDPNARFLRDRGFLFRRRVWFVGTCCPPARIDGTHYGHLSAVQWQHPVAVARSGPRVWWWF